jgi:hypothetical protein
VMAGQFCHSHDELFMTVVGLWARIWDGKSK